MTEQEQDDLYRRYVAGGMPADWALEHVQEIAEERAERRTAQEASDWLASIVIAARPAE